MVGLTGVTATAPCRLDLKTTGTGIQDAAGNAGSWLSSRGVTIVKPQTVRRSLRR